MGARGSITALYTILYEDESGGDPISEEVRGILDGHMILSRKIAAKNQYPAIDVLGSLSRVMSQIVPRAHQASAGKMRKLMAKYDEMEMLIQMGEYKPGNDALADEAVQKIDVIRDFLCQSTDDLWGFDKAVKTMSVVAGA
jgi:type III secretion protein N (ATPase)